MTGEAAEAAFFIPSWLQESVVLARNLALIAIPFLIWGLTRAVEKRRATLDVVRNLDDQIVSHLERLFLYRRYEEGSAVGLSQIPENPYSKNPAQFLFDSVIVLNLYEAICTEIAEQSLDEELLYKSIRNSIIGAYEVVLTRYNAKVGTDQSAHYVNLVGVSRRWMVRADRHGQRGASRIPGP